MSVFRAVLWKELVCEWRSRERLPAILLFALLTVVVLRFAQPGGASVATRDAAPGLLWVAYVFAAVLGMNRSLALELENDALSALALAPVDRGWIFLGKAVANFLLLATAQLATAICFTAVFDVALAPVALAVAGIAPLGAHGLSAVGARLAAISVRTRYREVMLPVLLFPLLVPLLVAAVQATSALLEGAAPSPAALQLLFVWDAVLLIPSFVLFEFVLDE